MDKKYTLFVTEETVFGTKANTHRGGRIEIHESDKKHHIEEIRLLLPEDMFDKLKNKLQGLELK